jgi:hypothetical protein
MLPAALVNHGSHFLTYNHIGIINNIEQFIGHVRFSGTTLE